MKTGGFRLCRCAGLLMGPSPQVQRDSGRAPLAFTVPKISIGCRLFNEKLKWRRFDRGWLRERIAHREDEKKYGPHDRTDYSRQ
jgi:hypothetical protein